MSKKWLELQAKYITGTRPVVFCFHHAGGNANVYREWKRCKTLEFIAMDLPGHGIRSMEPLIDRIDLAAQDMVEDILELKQMKNITEFALFGHSLGAILAYKVADILMTERKVFPRSLHVAGRHAPPDEDPSPYRVSQGMDALEKELREIGQTPEEVFHNEEFREFFLPMIYSDYAMSESYCYEGRTLDIPLFAYCGMEDNYADKRCMERWEKVTTGAFRVQEFAGNHFFVLENKSFFQALKADVVEACMWKQSEECERGWI